jgi:cytochrome c oxidase assembly protein Cox11
LVLVAAGGWLVWRYTAPVRVSFAAEIGDLPFTVETLPPVVVARPGEVVSMTYRIRNNNVTPVSAFGRLEFVPATAEQQMVIYITQCGGLNTYQNNYADDYDVVFRVAPAGLWGTSRIEVRHTFTRASPP